MSSFVTIPSSSGGLSDGSLLKDGSVEWTSVVEPAMFLVDARPEMLEASFPRGTEMKNPVPALSSPLEPVLLPAGGQK